MRQELNLIMLFHHESNYHWNGVMLQLNRLVTEKYVDGWDDPRLMTLAGLRCRGVTPSAINSFVRGIGITRRLTLSLSPSLLHDP